MFTLPVTKEQADEINAARHDPWRMVEILSGIAGDEFVKRYTSHPLPRPLIQMILPARCEKIKFTVGFLYIAQLSSTATYHVSGRGTIKVCRVDSIPKPGPIQIDGESLIVVGTESAHNWKPGDEIGIIVKADLGA